MIDRYILELTLSSVILLITYNFIIRGYKHPNCLTLNDIAIWTTGLAFGIAPFIYIYNGGIFQDNNLLDVFLSYFGILLFIYGLKITRFKNFEISHLKSFKGSYFSSLNEIVNNISKEKIILIYLLFFIIRLYIGVKYELLVSGSETEDRILSLPYEIIIIRSIINFFIFPSMVWSATQIVNKKKLTFVPSVILFSEFIQMFFQGRRQILFLFFVFLFVSIVLTKKIKKRLIIWTAIIAFVFITIISPSFLIFRNLYLDNQNKINSVDNVLYNLPLLFSTNNNSELNKENLRIRSYINDWNLKIIERSGIFDGLNGKVFLLSAYWIIPRFLLPNKYSTITPEFLINRFSNNQITDSPENLVGYGFADFGLIGSLIYGMTFGIILSFVENIANRFKDRLKFMSLSLISVFMFTAFSVEQSLISVFAVLRSALILFVLYHLAKIPFNWINFLTKK